MLCEVCSNRGPDLGHVCQVCHNRMLSVLNQIRELYEELAENVAVGQKPSKTGVRVRGTKEQPIPVNLDVIDAQNLAEQRLAAWVHEWSEELGIGYNQPTRAVPLMCDWLRLRLDLACSRYAPIGDFEEHMRDLLRHMRSALKMRPTRVRYDGTCQNCEYDVLVLYVQDFTVRCPRCKTDCDPDEFLRQLAKMNNGPTESNTLDQGIVDGNPVGVIHSRPGRPVPENGQLISIPDAAQLLGVPQYRVRNWASRGKLTKYGLSENGNPLYRESDIREVARVMNPS